MVEEWSHGKMWFLEVDDGESRLRESRGTDALQYDPPLTHQDIPIARDWMMTIEQLDRPFIRSGPLGNLSTGGERKTLGDAKY